MKIKLFEQKNCVNCSPAKAVCQDLENAGVTVEYIDTDDVDGMVEANMHTVMGTPILIVLDEDKEIKRLAGREIEKGKVLEHFR